VVGKVGYCAAHVSMAGKPSKWLLPTQRAGLYGRKWQDARRVFLAEHPLCRMCEQLGRTTAAEVVDHIEPHRGDETKFWARTNWQPLCKRCHDGAKQEQEKTGTLRGCNVDGVPLDPTHPWSRGE
jgi:5-methylcytosine-specific restriction endonuclease McrA